MAGIFYWPFYLENSKILITNSKQRNKNGFYFIREEGHNTTHCISKKFLDHTPGVLPLAKQAWHN